MESLNIFNVAECCVTNEGLFATQTVFLHYHFNDLLVIFHELLDILRLSTTVCNKMHEMLLFTDSLTSFHSFQTVYFIPISDRFRTAVNVSGDSYAAAIVEHVCRKELAMTAFGTDEDLQNISNVKPDDERVESAS